MNQELRILWLYPDILNLHGDRGNAMAVVRVCEQAGVKSKLTRVHSIHDPIDFESADLILLGSGELASMPAMIGALSPYAGQLAQIVDSGVPMLVTGTSAAIVARETIRVDSSRFQGLSLIDATVIEREAILGDDLMLEALDCALQGIQIRMTDLRLGHAQTPFARVVYGLGNADRPDAEGARRSHLMVTNLVGPALTKNPWFAWELVKLGLIRRYGEAPGAPGEQAELWRFELASARRIAVFNMNKKTAPGTIRLSPSGTE